MVDCEESRHSTVKGDRLIALFFLSVGAALSVLGALTLIDGTSHNIILFAGLRHATCYFVLAIGLASVVGAVGFHLRQDWSRRVLLVICWAWIVVVTLLELFGVIWGLFLAFGGGLFMFLPGIIASLMGYVAIVVPAWYLAKALRR